MHKKWQRIELPSRVEESRRKFPAPKFAKIPKFVAFLTRHPIGSPIVLFIVLLGLSVGSFLLFTNHKEAARPREARIVILSYDHHEQTVPSSEATVGQLVKKLRIPIHEGDVIEPTPTTRINQDDFRINIYRAVPVKIADVSNTVYTYSAATTSRSIADQAGIKTFPEDELTTEPIDNFLRDHAIGEQVVIKRSTPVALNLYGANVPVRTHAKTVRDMLKEKHFKILKADTVQPSLDAPITPGIAVSVIRNGVQTVNEAHEIPMPEQIVNDPNLAYGTTAVRQVGAPGKQVVTYQITVQNGAEVSRVVLQTVTTLEPITQIIAKGINLGGIKGDMALAGISPNDYNYVDYIVSHESGWNPQAQNASGAYGLCQALPGSKMASAGSDWATNPVTQLKWCNSYAVSKYGGWAGAYNYWVAHRYW